MESITKGDEVLTTGGLIGRVTKCLKPVMWFLS